tara:strand:- start:9965 stop:11470 length:1506 start_codon:yes stop_codon:yes gene_type:complete
MDNLETRDVEFRFDEETRTVSGIAVPYGQEANIGGAYTESFKRGSIAEDVTDVKLFYGHAEPIGRVIEGRDTELGFEITAKISDTARGNEVRTLLKDGVLNKFSVGFVPVNSEKDGNTVVRTEVSLREVSIVPFPAYAGATVTEVREDDTTNTKEVPTMESVNDNINIDVDGVKEDVAELRRLVETGFATTSTPTQDTRSAGEMLKAFASGDETAIRAYEGATTADSVLIPGFVGDLTRIVEQAATMYNSFSKGQLPASGLSLEYAQLSANTTTVAEQAAEGDDLGFGKVSLEIASAAIKTFGGYTQLTRQEIERSSVAVLDHSLRAMAVAAGKTLNNFVRTNYVTEHSAQVTDGNVVQLGGATATDWLDAIVDGAVAFDVLGLGLEAIVVSPTEFKALVALEGTDGRPMMLVTGNGVNNVGNLNVSALGGSLANIPVIVDAGLAAGKAAFVNTTALRTYSSGLVRLQDENIINLSKDFSVYQYAAVAHENPTAIVPIVAA